jgi:hypothetical protein
MDVPGLVGSLHLGKQVTLGRLSAPAQKARRDVALPAVRGACL